MVFSSSLRKRYTHNLDFGQKPDMIFSKTSIELFCLFHHLKKILVKRPKGQGSLRHSFNLVKDIKNVTPSKNTC